jgi:enamine deaminase RidA (YjgF/YER057c/UK114 family)
MSVETRLLELGISLPAPAPAAGNFVPTRVSGTTLFASGQGPRNPDGTYVIGKVGGTVTPDQAVAAARLTAINLLAAMQAGLGSLDRVSGILKVFGMVNCAPGFTDTPTVINGCSDLLVAVFGDAGRHARSAVGVAELPFGICVEIELEAEILD